MKILIILAAFLMSCEKENQAPVKTCYECQIIEQGIYIANLDTCFAGAIPPAYFGAELRCTKN